MRILIENYRYAPDSMTSLLPGHYLLPLPDGTVCTRYTGYYYSGRTSQAVFILPKVFLDVNARICGAARPEQLLETGGQRHKEQIDPALERLMSGLPVWLHQAMRRYRDSTEGQRAVSGESMPVIHCGHPGDHSSLFEHFISITAFYRRHIGLMAFSTTTAARGKKIRWHRTVAHELPVISDNTPVYLQTLRYHRTPNPEEELLTLFYSTLEYFRDLYGFGYARPEGHQLLRPHEFRRMLDGGGIILLRSIRHRYFRDVFVQLWRLLYAFFDTQTQIRHAGHYEEAMMCSDFPVVFEAMVDDLISDDNHEVPKHYREQRDGKRVDHLYRGRDLLGDRDIFYIGDSKYYGPLSDVQGQALDKQYTYARNVIQYNIEALLPGSRHRPVTGIRYRDELTEGYNVTPNFFIRGVLRLPAAGDERPASSDPLTDDLWCSTDSHVHTQMQFINRLFDRDTLMVLSYDISFIFVLRAYITQDAVLKAGFRDRARILFRTRTVAALNEHYYFYRYINSDPDEMKTFIMSHYRSLIGKIYITSDGRQLLLAMDRAHDGERRRILGIFSSCGIAMKSFMLE